MRQILGWFFLAIGTMAAFAEPQSGIGSVAIAGAILIAAERIAAGHSQRIPN